MDEINNQKGFIYESDIRNFAYLFEKHNEKIFLFFSSIRSRTIFEEIEQNDDEPEFEDELRETVYNLARPIKTILYDVMGNC